MRQFFQKRTAAHFSGTAATTEQHLATLDWLRAVGNAIRCGLGSSGLSAFQTTEVPFDAPDNEDMGVESVPLAVLSMDSESKQRSGFFYLRSLGFSVLMLQPLHHRKNNDVELSLNRAGFGPTMKRRMLIANSSYGPWHSSAFFEDTKDSACNLSENCHPPMAYLWCCGPAFAPTGHSSTCVKWILRPGSSISRRM